MGSKLCLAMRMVAHRTDCFALAVKRMVAHHSDGFRSALVVGPISAVGEILWVFSLHLHHLGEDSTSLSGSPPCLGVSCCVCV